MKLVLIDDMSGIKEGGDLLLAKDFFPHLPNMEIEYFMKHILYKYKYVLFGFDDTEEYHRDIPLGQWRKLNLLPPFTK